MSSLRKLHGSQFLICSILLSLSSLSSANIPTPVKQSLSPEVDALLKSLPSNDTAKEKITIAVIDTGVDYTHEDLQGQMWVNSIEQSGLDGVDDDNNGCVDDIYGCDFRGKVKRSIGYYPGIGGAYYRGQRYMYADDMGHGTLVAGIIGAVANNGVGIDGISQAVRIMSVKIIYPYNVASFADAAKAIYYAVDNGAKIINNSYGKSNISDEHLAVLEDAIDYAHQHGVLLIAAAGNNGSNIDSTHSYYPANIDAVNLLSVTALNQQNELWKHANIGPWSVDIAAPGVGIYTTAPKGEPSLFRKFYDPRGYISSDGTSMATAYVSGVAALLFSHYPDLSHLQIKKLILDSSSKLPGLTKKIVAGGKTDLYNALRLAADTRI